MNASVAAPAKNPYVGPRPFEEDQAEFFFGRDFEARELAALIVSERIVLLYSPSGAGKTSLLQARVLPELRRQKFTVLPIVRLGRSTGREMFERSVGNRYLEST